MSLPTRPIAFVLAASNHGSLIVNRNDYHKTPDYTYGVGYQILEASSYEGAEVGFALALLGWRRHHFGPGVFAIDGGANIGVHLIEWARHMTGWGRALGFEPQEAIFYALAGNVALNNCMNARVRYAALGQACGELQVPQPNYFAPGSFGSLELRENPTNEFIGQPISYDRSNCSTVAMVALDSLQFDRLDLIKLDVEGMELDVLRGGVATLRRHRPAMIVEVLKTNRAALEQTLAELGYRTFSAGMNLVALHETDPTLPRLSSSDGRLSLDLAPHA